MDSSEYISNRVDPQINWYDEKCAKSQSIFKTLQITQASCAAAIPLISGFEIFSQQSPLAVGILGAAIAIISAWTSIGRHQELWAKYRATGELLKQEKYLYLTATEPYGTSLDFNLFVQRIEKIILKENSAWSESIKSNPDTPKKS